MGYRKRQKAHTVKTIDGYQLHSVEKLYKEENDVNIWDIDSMRASLRMKEFIL